jgi:hypothetical protein
VRKDSLRILLVDSRDSGSADPRLRRVARALGRYAGGAEGYFGVRRAADGALHDLSAFDLALIHETDARKGDAAFYDLCRQAATPCVLYTGARADVRAVSERLLLLSDTDVLAHAEAGADFLRETGALNLTVWTEGLHSARVHAVAEICGGLRQAVLFGPSPLQAALPDAQWSAALTRLRASSHNPRFQRVLTKIEAALAEVSGQEVARGEGAAAEARRRLTELLGELPLVV